MVWVFLARSSRMDTEPSSHSWQVSGTCCFPTTLLVIRMSHILLGHLRCMFHRALRSLGMTCSQEDPREPKSNLKPQILSPPIPAMVSPET